jgi:DNA-binding Lrp family transcriptional regulator
MARKRVDDEVLATVRNLGRPARFREIAEAVEAQGFSRSQVHNAVYRLGKSGRLLRLGTRSSMTYMAAAS